MLPFLGVEFFSIYVMFSIVLLCTAPVYLILTNLNKVGYAAGNIYIKFVAFFLGKWPANFTSSLLMCHRFWECIVYICFGEAVYIFTFPITSCAICIFGVWSEEVVFYFVHVLLFILYSNL